MDEKAIERFGRKASKEEGIKEGIKQTAKKMKEKANEMLENGYELVTMSITGTAKAILVFKK